MPPSPTDQIAREAARLYHDGRVAELREAIHVAADVLGFEDAPRPRLGRVRQHLQALSMSALGAEGYRDEVHGIYEAIEQCMTGITELLDGVEPMLVGRAARGLVDGSERIHVRLYTEASVAELADVLEQLGYESPQLVTADTRFGRLNQLIVEEEGFELVLTRCPRATRSAMDVDLFNGQPIARLDVEGVRRLIQSGKWKVENGNGES